MTTLEHYLLQHATATPSRVAVVSQSEQFTYSQLLQLSREKASQLQAQGVGEGQIVFFRASQDVRFLATYFGIHMAGAVAAPLEEDCPEDKLQYLQDNFGHITLTPDIADVLFTTGTTGAAKGVKISHSTILAEAENLALAQGFTPQTYFVICGPLNHIGSLSKIFPIIVQGGTICITQGMKDIDAIFHAFDHPAGLVGTFLVPASIRILLQFGKDRLAALADKIDFIETGAAAINEADMQTLCQILPRTRLFNTYASTETGIISTYNFNDGNCQVGCLGPAMKNSRFFITPDGFVACTGKTLMSGYLGDDELTASILRDDTIYTADMGYVDPQGMLHLQGRAGDVINVGGFKVNPLEVENAALSFPGVKDCICISHLHPVLGTMLKLLLVFEPEQEFSKRSLALHIASLLERHKVPQQYELTDHIERTFNGKLNRKFYRG